MNFKTYLLLQGRPPLLRAAPGWKPPSFLPLLAISRNLWNTFTDSWHTLNRLKKWMHWARGPPSGSSFDQVNLPHLQPRLIGMQHQQKWDKQKKRVYYSGVNMERTCYRLQSLHSFPLPALVKAGQVSFGSMPIVGLKSISSLSPVSPPKITMRRLGSSKFKRRGKVCLVSWCPLLRTALCSVF